MTTKKQSTSKVRNTKATFKTGKNDHAEALIRHSFEPLLSPKDSKARLTFCGVEHSIIEWSDRGNHQEKPVMKLVFSCLDITHEMPVNIAVTCDYRISENNRLGLILSIMGYEFKKETISVDEDDEYGIKTKHSEAKEIFDFLRAQCGLVFKGNLTVAKRKDKQTGEYIERQGLWDVAYKTLEPKMKNDSQERDMMASDVTDEMFENPDISMASETD